MDTLPSVVVTGATGFVGSRVTKRLVAEGYRVHVITRRESKLTQIEDVLESLVIHHADGTAARILDIFDQARPKIVFHLGALFRKEHTVADIDVLADSNFKFTCQILEAMTHVHATNLVNTGTSWQHFENRAYDPVCLYAATKQAAESVIDFYCNTREVHCITLKLFDTYGTNDPRPKLFSLLENAARTQDTVAMSQGQQRLDLVHIHDIVAAYSIAARRLLSGVAPGHEKFALASGRYVSLREVVKLYEQITNRKVNILWGGRPYHNREVMSPWTGGEALPGWQPKIPLEEGIASLLVS